MSFLRAETIVVNERMNLVIHSVVNESPVTCTAPQDTLLPKSFAPIPSLPMSGGQHFSTRSAETACPQT